jgi:hypothetical protein
MYEHPWDNATGTQAEPSAKFRSLPEDMMICVKLIPQQAQRYDTEGDRRWHGVRLEIRLSGEVIEDDPRYGIVLLTHELVGALLCRSRGVTDRQVDAFYIAFKGSGEPGDDPAAPYDSEHEAGSGCGASLGRRIECRLPVLFGRVSVKYRWNDAINRMMKGEHLSGGDTTPEQAARQAIDKQLSEAGWVVQSRDAINLSDGRGVAIREFKMADGHGYADYLLYVDKQAVGALEAKPAGFTLTGVKPQIDKYSNGLPTGLPAPIRPLPFVYVSTGIETNFVNLLDPEPRSRRIFNFHRPETIAEWLQAHNLPEWVRAWGGDPPALNAVRAVLPSSLRARLRAMPPVAIANLWENKQRALENLERSFRDDRPRALIQMATGSGKTMLAIVRTPVQKSLSEAAG